MYKPATILTVLVGNKPVPAVELPATLPALGMDGVMGLRVGFININDMYNNDVVRGEYMPMKLMK